MSLLAFDEERVGGNVRGDIVKTLRKTRRMRDARSASWELRGGDRSHAEGIRPLNGCGAPGRTARGQFASARMKQTAAAAAAAVLT